MDHIALNPPGTDVPEACLARAIDMVGDRGFEVELTAWLRSELAFDNITVLAYFKDATPRLLHRAASDSRVHARLDSAYLEGAYLEGAYLLDPFHQLHLDGAPDGLYRLQDIAPDHFLRGEYFLTYYAGTTLTDEIAYVVEPAPQVTVTLCLGRDASSGRRFSARDLTQAARIAPICVSLARRHWSTLRPEAQGVDRPSIAERLRNNVSTRLGIDLTPRQADVAVLILKGHSTASIALKLDLSPQTIKVFRKQLYHRCTISSQAELFSLLLPMLAVPADQ